MGNTTTGMGAAVTALMGLADSLDQRAAMVRGRSRVVRLSLEHGQGIDARDRLWLAKWRSDLHRLDRDGGLDRALKALPAATKAPLVKVWNRIQAAESNMAGAFDRLARAATASPRPAAASPKPGGPPVRTPSTAIPSPAKPVIAPRPQTNPNAPMTGAARSIDAAAAVVVRHTLQAAAMTLSRVLGRPENDVLKALASQVNAESAAGRDFATALDRAKATVAASVRSGVA